jgi:hypothetical protein
MIFHKKWHHCDYPYFHIRIHIHVATIGVNLGIILIFNYHNIHDAHMNLGTNFREQVLQTPPFALSIKLNSRLACKYQSFTAFKKNLLKYLE